MLDKTSTARNAALFGELLQNISGQAKRGPMARHDAHNALREADPILALICEIEAHADQRIFSNDCANSKLTTIRRLAREAMVKLTGEETNPIYPATRESPTDRWQKSGA